MTETKLFDDLRHYDAMYAIGLPEVSDYQYDIIRSEAKLKYPNNEYWNQVGADMGGDKVKLPCTLGSLNKVKADGSCQEWLQGHSDERLVSAKLDGVSLYVSYVNGKYDRAFLRGNGEYGYEVTERARLFVPLELQEDVTCEARSEAILTQDIHTKLGYATRRNGVAGLLNPNRTTTEHLEKVVVKFYELISTSEGLGDTESERWDQMIDYGLDVAPHVMLGTTDPVQAEEQLKDILSTWKESLEYDIDGLVVAEDDSIPDDSFYPENKVAYKVNEDAILCKVVKVEWSVGRTGRVVPVVWIEPTLIGGVTVEKATGFNFKFIVDAGIGPGSVVGIYRSGDVIPYIDFVEESVAATHPMFCSDCDNILKKSGVDLVCDNAYCKGRNVLAAEYFLRTLGVEEVTAVTLRKLGVKGIFEAYCLDELEIAQVDGFGIRRAEEIVTQIEKSLKTTPDKFLAACGLPNVGLSTAQDFLKVFKFEDYIDFTNVGLDYTVVSGIGPAIAKSLDEGRERVARLYDMLYGKGLEWSTASNTLMGKVFCMTGNGPIKRDVLENMIEANGGYVKGMSKKVDYLVTNNPSSTSGKAKKAREYGTEVIGYDNLIEMLEG